MLMEAKHQIVNMIVFTRQKARREDGYNLSLPAVKNADADSRSSQTQCFTCHTARKQLVFILIEAPVGVFQVASSKNNLVTLHSTRQPSGGQRDGVKGGRNSNTLLHHHHQPNTISLPKTLPLVSVAWHGPTDETGHVCFTFWHTVVCVLVTPFSKNSKEKFDIWWNGKWGSIPLWDQC